NSGGNEVLVYLGTDHGQFGPAHRFRAGDNPVGITVASLNDTRMTEVLAPGAVGPVQTRDPYVDLVVANEGSNDVSILLGQGSGAAWTFKPGRRLKAGLGPVATAVQDVVGTKGTDAPDGIPDILTANSMANTVSLVPALGNGFFNDQPASRRTFPT